MHDLEHDFAFAEPSQPRLRSRNWLRSRRDRLRCGDCCHRPNLFRLAGFPSELRTAPEGSVRRRKDRSHPIWGRSEATHSGGVLLAPLPRECKCDRNDSPQCNLCACWRPDPDSDNRPVTAASPPLAGPRNLHMRIALYQPDIPQNTGTILRLCACLGIEAHIIGPAGFPASDRAFRRAGMDYLDAVAHRPPPLMAANSKPGDAAQRPPPYSFHHRGVLLLSRHRLCGR